MAEYQTESIINSNKIEALKRDCSFLSKEIGKKTLEIASDFEIVSNALNYVASKLYNINLDKAENLYQNAWFKMSNTTLCKRLWSQTELTKWLNENSTTGKIKDLCERLGNGAKLLKEMKQYIDKIAPIMDIVNAIQIIYSENVYKISIKSENLDSCSQIRSAMRSGVQQFEAVMDVIRAINNFAPRGFKEYIDYNLRVFEGAEKLFKIADNYSSILKELARDTEDVWEKALNKKSSWWNATKSLERDMDANLYLDRIERQGKLDDIKRKYDRDHREIQRQRW